MEHKIANRKCVVVASVEIPADRMQEATGALPMDKIQNSFNTIRNAAQRSMRAVSAAMKVLFLKKKKKNSFNYTLYTNKKTI